MSDRQLLDGSPVPEDGSHREIQPSGMQKSYVVLSPEERAKGFVKPLRYSYIHAMPTETERTVGCGAQTRMGAALSETYARNPRFYSGTFCVGCRAHFPLNQFIWEDGEPMDPDLQDEWNAGRADREAAKAERAKQARIAYLNNQIAMARSELATLEQPLPGGENHGT